MTATYHYTLVVTCSFSAVMHIHFISFLIGNLWKEYLARLQHMYS